MDKIRSIVCFFAHPDDESFVCGGMLARFSKQGAHTVIVCATDGRRGGRGYDREVTPEAMKKLRRHEVLRSAKILGVSKLICWHYRDKKLALSSKKNIYKRIKLVLSQYQPDLVITFGKGGITGHKDHIAIGRFVTACLKKQSDIILWHASFLPHIQKRFSLNDTKTNPPNVYVNVQKFKKQKLASIQAHKSQVFTRARVGVRGERAPKDFFTIESFYQASPYVQRTIGL